MYDNRAYVQGQTASDNIGYATLNPAKYEASAPDPVQEQ